MIHLGILVLSMLVGFTQAQGMSFFGGIIQYTEYESSLPCKTDNKSPCQSVRGALGFALDNASQAGLMISNVVEKPGVNTASPQVFLTTEKYGTCRVETTSQATLGPLGFSCSSLGLINNSLVKIDRLFSLTTRDDQQFALQDVTQASKLKREL